MLTSFIGSIVTVISFGFLVAFITALLCWFSVFRIIVTGSYFTYQAAKGDDLGTSRWAMKIFDSRRKRAAKATLSAHNLDRERNASAVRQALRKNLLPDYQAVSSQGITRFPLSPWASLRQSCSSWHIFRWAHRSFLSRSTSSSRRSGCLGASCLSRPWTVGLLPASCSFTWRRWPWGVLEGAFTSTAAFGSMAGSSNSPGISSGHYLNCESAIAPDKFVAIFPQHNNEGCQEC